jgi:hypothetical protein
MSLFKSGQVFKNSKQFNKKEDSYGVINIMNAMRFMGMIWVYALAESFKCSIAPVCPVPVLASFGLV